MISVGIRQRMKTYGASRLPWLPTTLEHRCWYGLDAYYAMFSAPFVIRTIKTFARPGDVLMDPLCGLTNAD